ncbi:VWA domain-containing protein [Candidatus Woesearchaeota archaeon]|nr:VWA domain-containing protein [Candidatus Woesearchaeota archaeon]
MGIKKGVFFTIDALLASGIIIVAVLLVSNFYSEEQQTVNVNYASQDLVRVFSTMTVGEANNDYVKGLISSGQITGTNNTILEQIGDFWADDEIGLARNLTANLSDAIIPKNYGFSVLVNGEEIYSRNMSVKRSLVSSRKLITGIAKAKPTEGFTSRVLLNGIKSKKTSAYAYFGGYEGDGNLTKKLVLPNDVISFNSSYLEIDAGGDFNLYINGFFSGSYVKGSSGGGNMLADKWNLSNVYVSNLRAGENVININFTSGSSYIAGGFLRVTYTTSSYNDTQISGYEKYRLPGIDGIINLYSSVYSPGAVNNMQVFLNYSSNYTTYLRLGNTTIYEESPENKGSISPDSSTVLLMHFEEGSGQNADDSSQYNNDGTLGSSAGSDANDPSWDTGKIGNYALKFDGVDDYVKVSDSSSLRIGKDVISMEAWILPKQSGTMDRLIEKDGPDGNRGYQLNIHTTKKLSTTLTPCSGLNGFNADLTGNTILTDNEWHHAAMTYDGNTVTYYLDGVNDGQYPYTNGFCNNSNNNAPLLIGNSNNAADRAFEGTMDEVAVWNEALNPSEIGQVYQSGSGNNVVKTIPNSTLRTLIDYGLFNQKTVPLRMGITNATSIGGTADAMLVSDVSGSMEWCSQTTSYSWGGWVSDSNKGCLYWFGSWLWGAYNQNPSGTAEYSRMTWNDGSNNLCGCRYTPICGSDTTKLSLYKNAGKQFANISLNISGNRMGLVDFTETNTNPVYINSCSPSSSTTTVFADSVARTNNLISDEAQMSSVIDATASWWGTCTCCGINKAVDILNAQSSSQRKKYVVLMSDGAANVQCSQQPNGTATADAVQSAWDACSQGISVYTIAFGLDADTTTMQRMNCSGGKYYNAVDTSQIQQAYKDIAGEINKLSFSGQIVNISGSLAKSTLHPSSYVEFNYTAAGTQFNKIPLSFETERFGNNASSGTLAIYANTSVQDAKVTSYSGTKWTDSLVVNGNTIYRLTDYGNDYQILGDPFAVNIPAGNINEGSNSITISTGINSTASAGGSFDNRVIYNLLLNGFADYSTVVAKSDGCSWNVAFEDGSFSTVKVPSTYSGGDSCSYTSSSKSYDVNDALDNSVYQLFNNLDADKDGRLEFNIDASNLDVNTLTISKVPSLWGPAIIEIRVWE